ncbi:MAG: hypothetical protein K6E84_00445 [Lachnospiraceae bacterium]|nr:hypothetical protein [Lachnospiraceae bacterium]
MPRTKNHQVNYTKNDFKMLIGLANDVGEVKLGDQKKIEDKLSGYIRANENSEDPSKVKKVAAAKVLLPFLKKGGTLEKIKNSMAQSVPEIQEELEEKFEKNPQVEVIDGMDVNMLIYKGFDELKRVDDMDDDAGILRVDQALTDFFEEQNFAEYEDDSPLKDIVDSVKTCVNAWHANEHILANGDRQRYFSDNPEEKMRNMWRTFSKKNVQPLISAYDNDLDLEKVQRDRKQTRTELVRVSKEITSLQRQYDEQIKAESKARNDLALYENEYRSVERELEDESRKAISGEGIRMTIQEREAYYNAMRELALAHKDITDGLNSQPPKQVNLFKEAQEDARAYEQMKQEVDSIREKTDPDLLIEKLVANDLTDKEAARTALKKFYNDAVASKTAEKKWNQINGTFINYKNLFSDDPDIMNFLISNDDTLVSRGFQKLQNEYAHSDDPDKRSLYDQAVGLKSRIIENMDEKLDTVFNYDGKTDQKTYLATLEKNLSEKPLQIRKDFAENNRVFRAYRGFTKSDERLTENKELLEAEMKKGDQADPKLIEEYSNNMTKFAQKKSEYDEQLLSLEIKYADQIKALDDLANQNVSSDSLLMNYHENKLNQAKKKADKSAAKAKKIKDAVELLNKSAIANESNELQDLIHVVTAENPDYSKLPKSVAFMDKVFEKKKESLNKNNERKMKELQERKAQLYNKKAAADQVINNLKTGELLDKLVEKCTLQNRLTKQDEVLTQKEKMILAVGDGAKQYMKQQYDSFKAGVKNFPTYGTEKAYERIFDKIESLRHDYSKCMRKDYARNPNKNSTEYKLIKEKLDSFGTREDFYKLTKEEIAQKLGQLQKAASDYKTKKLDETRLWWSAQRRYRLSYADRIVDFAKGESKILTGILAPGNDEQDLARVKELSTKFENVNPNGKKLVFDQEGFPSLEPKTKEDVAKEIFAMQPDQAGTLSDFDAIDRFIEKTKKDILKKLDKSSDQISDRDVAHVLIGLDILNDVKKDLRDPKALLLEGNEEHLAKIKEALTKQELSKKAGEIQDNKYDYDLYLDSAARMDKLFLSHITDPQKVLDHREKMDIRADQKSFALGRLDSKRRMAEDSIHFQVNKNIKSLNKDNLNDAMDQAGIGKKVQKNNAEGNQAEAPKAKRKPAKKTFQPG